MPDPVPDSIWDTISITDVILALGGLAALCFIVIVVFKIVRVMHPMLVKATRVFDLFLGRPAEQGIPAVPGVIERLDSQDKVLENQGKRLTSIELQVTPNHGSTDKLADKIAKLEERFSKIEKHIGVDNG